MKHENIKIKHETHMGNKTRIRTTKLQNETQHETHNNKNKMKTLKHT